MDDSQARPTPIQFGVGSFTVSGCHGSDILRMLGTSDEAYGAHVEEYRGGNLIAHLNRGTVGGIHLLPRASRWRLWVLSLRFWPSCWSWQANYGGGCIASSAVTKWGAIREARFAIDGMRERNA